MGLELELDSSQDRLESHFTKDEMRATPRFSTPAPRIARLLRFGHETCLRQPAGFAPPYAH